MKVIVFSFFTVFVFNLWAQDVCSVIPTPTRYQDFHGTVKLGQRTLVKGDPPKEIYGYLLDHCQSLFGMEIERAQSNVQLSFVHDQYAPSGNYTINVDNEITLTYSSDESCFHGVNTLLQLIQSNDGERFIPKCFIEDSPKFPWRGLHMDVCRHFFTVDEVKRYIDLMALYKFNVLHWHLTDDQGWRIEIKKYPKLTEIGAYRDSTIIGHYNAEPRQYKVEHYGGFYTQQEIREVVAYATSKYITVVPEIEMPGHSRAALAAYPELGCTGEFQPVPGLWGVFDDIYCSKPESIAFMKDVLAEVLELFPSEYIHIGGDEAPKIRWKECPNCQKVIKKNKLNDEHELQSYFIRQMDDYLTKKGRKLIGWDEILEGGLSPNAAVMSWRGEEGGIEAAKQHHEVVMTPTSYCYFDYYQSTHKVEPLAIGGYLPLEKVYQFNPVPKELTEDEAKYILGGQANLWTEYISDMDQLEYMAYPRALALIQSLWCVNKPDYNRFLLTYLTYQEPFLEKNKVHFAQSIHYPDLKIERAKKGINVHFEGADPESIFTVQEERTGDLPTIIRRQMSANDSVYIERLYDDALEPVTFSVTSEDFREQINYEIGRHSALGLPIELVTPPHPKYSHNGGLNLVDGIFGSKPWNGRDWLGFNIPKIEMIVDLTQETTTNLLLLSFLKSNGSWIYLPEKVTVLGSIDKVEWEVLGENSDGKKNGEAWNVDLAYKNVRYLKLVIETMNVIPDGMDGAGNVPWTFMDEINLSYLRP